MFSRGIASLLTCWFIDWLFVTLLYLSMSIPLKLANHRTIREFEESVSN